MKAGRNKTSGANDIYRKIKGKDIQKYRAGNRET
jgi:hypothetical protein